MLESLFYSAEGILSKINNIQPLVRPLSFILRDMLHHQTSSLIVQGYIVSRGYIILVKPHQLHIILNIQ